VYRQDTDSLTETQKESCLTDEWQAQGHLPGTLVCNVWREEKRKMK